MVLVLAVNAFVWFSYSSHCFPFCENLWSWKIKPSEWYDSWLKHLWLSLYCTRRNHPLWGQAWAWICCDIAREVVAYLCNRWSEEVWTAGRSLCPWTPQAVTATNRTLVGAARTKWPEKSKCYFYMTSWILHSFPALSPRGPTQIIIFRCDRHVLWFLNRVPWFWPF